MDESQPKPNILIEYNSDKQVFTIKINGEMPLPLLVNELEMLKTAFVNHQLSIKVQNEMQRQQNSIQPFNGNAHRFGKDFFPK